ncbi:hypothetical protein VaNZ11_003655 [Volvox africanus]|uniref:Uncharacterized protein n=1 Tax=Volvox africanus TaxID=51714 RepID=A0ABQ5RV42_9CHLO|nr:hypothetical protein VaNZ11_003655 [Volvox africanus]
MAHSCRAPSHRGFACRSSHGRKVVLVRAQTDTPKAPAVVSLMTTAALVLTAVPALSPPELMLLRSARADDTSEDLMTPYQRRQRELEKRRELLRQAREQAEGRAGGEVAAPSTAEADAAVEAANAERRAAASQLASELKNSATAYESSTATSRYRGFGGFNAAPAPEPAPAPAPTPAPAPKREVEVKQAATVVVKEVPKVQPRPQKRRGPLPLFLAELLVLGSFAGAVLAVTKYSEQTSKAFALAGAKGKELYAAAEDALAKAQQPK